MKKILLSLVTILVMTLAAPFTASAATSVDMTAYQFAVMNYDDDGNELGWSDWTPCNYTMSVGFNDIITMKMDRNYKFRIDDADDDWGVDGYGNDVYGTYCTDLSTGGDVTITFQYSSDGSSIVFFDSDEELIAFKVKNARAVRGQKSSKHSSGKKKSSSRHRRR